MKKESSKSFNKQTQKMGRGMLANNKIFYFPSNIKFFILNKLPDENREKYVLEKDKSP